MLIHKNMDTKILIVEDQFIEANNLSIMLEKAGYTVSFSAKSVEQALMYLEKELVDMVILDIFLKGQLNGIDLAISLNKLNIPFIYVSANSNPSIFEAAKETNPYGFLIKPFRKKDLLTSVEIASYRHQQEKDIVHKKEKWIAELLIGRLEENSTPEKKLLHLVKAINSTLSFDLVAFLPNVTNQSGNPVYYFHKIDTGEFIYNDGLSLLAQSNLRDRDMNDFIRHAAKKFLPQIETGEDFIDESYKTKLGIGIKEIFEVRSSLDFPLHIAGEKFLLSFYSTLSEGFNIENLDAIIPLRSLLGNVLETIFCKKECAVPENRHVVLHEEDEPEFPGIIGRSALLKEALQRVHQVACFDTTVLILGETGVGKEGIVQALHQLSKKRNRPLVKINCAAIPEHLLESELFGYERGAFTDAKERKIGKFEQADGGTVFLDEIGEMPLALQSKILRVLQEKEFERIGGRTTIKANVRFIAATNRNLYKEVGLGNFRMDLYYRLNVFPINVAPLRERKEDIVLLAAYFLDQQLYATGKNITGFSADVLEKLTSYNWPGNIRELQHIIERLVLMTDGSIITQFEIPEDDELQEVVEHRQEMPEKLDPYNKNTIIDALNQTRGKVSGRGGAAELLNIPAPSLSYQMKKMGIVWKFLLE